MYKLIRPLLFNFSKDPETVHNLALYFLKWGGFGPFPILTNLFTKTDFASLKQKVFGLDFPNPVGLAGGFDKNGRVVKGLEALGFGFIEIGTITRHSQPGNARQRMFRFNKDRALINRMGFNNAGADKIAQVLEQTKHNIPLGISLGKSKITDLEQSKEDYLYSFYKLYEFGDYFAVNVSSPNTPGLRQLQEKENLVEILSALSEFRAQQKLRKPILVKIAPDLAFSAIDEILEVCQNFKIDGIIATNTTVDRQNLKTETSESGGLSGKPLKNISTQIIAHVYKQMPKLPIIGVGGIFTAEDAYEKIKAGASLIQIYTGFIYEGPMVVKKINRGLAKLLRQDGYKNISEAVGRGA